MGKGRCAACKYLRRRCPPDCIFSPYFPPNDPQRFACVHKIYGASNVGKILQHLPSHLRADATDSLYIEAKCRIQDPVYGCVGIISLLEQQIQSVESQLAQTQADITILRSHAQDNLPPTQIGEAELNFDYLMQDQNGLNVSDCVNQQVSPGSTRDNFPDAN